MNETPWCDLYEKKGSRVMKCKDSRDGQYVWKDHNLAICWKHWKLEPAALDALCELSVPILVKEDKKREAKRVRPGHRRVQRRKGQPGGDPPPAGDGGAAG